VCVCVGVRIKIKTAMIVRIIYKRFGYPRATKLPV